MVDDERKDELIEKYRYEACDLSFEVAEMEALCRHLGFTHPDRKSHCHPKIYYDISYSQGDGACVTGVLFFDDDMADVLPEEFQNDEVLQEVHNTFLMYQRMQELYNVAHAEFTHRRYRYYDKRAVSMELCPRDVDADDMEEHWDAIYDNLYAAIIEAYRTLCRWIYKYLEAAYSAYTDDEYIWDYIVANGLHEEVEYA